MFSFIVQVSLICRVTVYFIDRDGDQIETKATIGSSFLTVALDNQVELEGTISHGANI